MRLAKDWQVWGMSGISRRSGGLKPISGSSVLYIVLRLTHGTMLAAAALLISLSVLSVHGQDPVVSLSASLLVNQPGWSFDLQFLICSPLWFCHFSWTTCIVRIFSAVDLVIVFPLLTSSKSWDVFVCWLFGFMLLRRCIVSYLLFLT